MNYRFNMLSISKYLCEIILCSHGDNIGISGGLGFALACTFGKTK